MAGRAVVSPSRPNLPGLPLFRLPLNLGVSTREKTTAIGFREIVKPLTSATGEDISREQRALFPQDAGAFCGITLCPNEASNFACENEGILRIGNSPELGYPSNCHDMLAHSGTL